MEMKLQHLHNDLADKNQWMTDTETLLKSPTFNLEDENISSEKVQQQSELVEVGVSFLYSLPFSSSLAQFSVDQSQQTGKLKWANQNAK